MNNDFILRLYRSPATVFTTGEVAQLFPSASYESIRDRLYYFTKIGKLQHPHQGMYAKQDYNFLELANKLYTPSYISLETVLLKSGVTFQYYETVFLVTYLTRTISVDAKTIQYRQIKKEALNNQEGIEQKTGYFIATPERAFLDAVYIYKNYHFDNLGAIDWDKARNIVKIYQSKAFEKRIEEYYQLYQEDYGNH